MIESLRPDKLTPILPADLYAALEQSWGLDSCTRSSILVLMAHWAIETGWGHFCHWYNLGNAKYTLGCGHDYCEFPCGETINGKNITIVPPAPGCQFVAFDSLEQGAAYYLTSLRGRFRAAWPAVLAGDPAEFSHMLKMSDYYTAPEAQYTATLVGCFQILEAKMPNASSPAPSA